MKTDFIKILIDWRMVKNLCRVTDNKDFTEKDATDTFKRKLLISEHSPIRTMHFVWQWKQIPYWLSMEWARHKHEKFISSQRDDRLIDDTPRSEKPQGALVNHAAEANMQNLIDAWRKRLCRKATKKARELAEDYKRELAITHPIEAGVLVPNCIYRFGCPEFQTCGWFNGFLNWCGDNGYEVWDMMDIEKRYEAYNDYFKATAGVKNDAE